MRAKYFVVYKKRMRGRALSLFGNRCCRCGNTKNLTFKQKEYKCLNGSLQRWRDILNNIHNYILVCRKCMHRSIKHDI
jgi:hypothetical protein